MNIPSLIAMLLLLAASFAISAQESLPARLGYAEDAKLLIVHADDIGFSHSANAATMQAFDQGPVRTGAIMVPPSWFPEIAAYASENTDYDFGIHLTLTSEWKYYRWDSVTPASEVPSLIDEEGYLRPTGPEVHRHADPGEANREVRAQIERALEYGIEPTHLDVHNMALWGTPELFDVFLNVGRDYRLPILMARGGQIAAVPSEFQSLLEPDDIVIDRVIMLDRATPAARWPSAYADLIAGVEPGVTQLIIHYGFEDTELTAMAVDRPNPDAGWRQRDFDYFTGAEFERMLERHDVQLIAWRDIADLMR